DGIRDFHVTGVQTCALPILELPEEMPTAFVCNCDQVAHHLINKLKLLGYTVPNDFSVVGFDNDIYASITEPGLTTVEVDIQEMEIGRASCREREKSSV